MTVAAPPRDPRRSLIIGAVIAGVVLLVMFLLVVVGLIMVYLPRRSDPEAAGIRSTPADAVLVTGHPAPTGTS